MATAQQTWRELLDLYPERSVAEILALEHVREGQGYQESGLRPLAPYVRAIELLLALTSGGWDVVDGIR